MTASERASVSIGGTVQGVGFRPFVYGLATRFALSGWVRNTGEGVEIEAEGSPADLEAFCRAVKSDLPPLAAISSFRLEKLSPKGGAGFAILASVDGDGGAQTPADSHVCDDCLAELFDPHDRRHLYPFINCTNCGPRYSIITSLPYDRERTTMSPFRMCQTCSAEYHDPVNRRFHAQPNACPDCGPRLRLMDRSGDCIAGDPLTEAVDALRRGLVVAVKGVGGYHLAVDAASDQALFKLRERKRRPHKPFAILAADLDSVASLACCSELEGRLLRGAERPILLLESLEKNGVSGLVAPGNSSLGIMLPGNPLQHLLARLFQGPLVMTSGNRSGEPIAFRDAEAVERLSGIADLFLSHDREIHAGVDDSVLRVAAGEPLFLRRSRGYVPRGVPLPSPQQSVLALGGDLKGAFCLTRERDAFMSQHLGDLATPAALGWLEKSIDHLESLLGIEPQIVAHDLHPDYLSTRLAQRLALPPVAVQHHHAHLASCMAENGLEGEAIGVILDGSGYGIDGAVWGGEFLIGGYCRFKRFGHFGYLRMPGGDAAVREPYRMAISALFATSGSDLFRQPVPFLRDLDPADAGLLMKMLERGINSPFTSSCGRLFDAVAAMLEVRRRVSYEGQAAIELESLALRGGSPPPYPYLVREEECQVLDFTPTVAAICADLAAGRERAEMARAFHATVARSIAEVCVRGRRESGEGRVALSGGVFQNRLLTEEVVALLEEEGFVVYRHRLVPPNDGGLALGQAVIAGRKSSP